MEKKYTANPLSHVAKDRKYHNATATNLHIVFYIFINKKENYVYIHIMCVYIHIGTFKRQVLSKNEVALDLPTD